MAVEPGRVIVLPGGVNLRESQLRFVCSRTPGPGGQNVNKVNSRVMLLFDIENCPDLSLSRKHRIINAFPGRISKQGVLRVVSSRFRTQAANRKASVKRFTELLTDALTPRKRRKKTTIPARTRARRLADKAHLSQRKRLRRAPGPDATES